jgi:hypothetical protein
MNNLNYILISFVGGIFTIGLILLIIKIYYRFTTRDYIPIDKNWIIVSV